MYEEADPANVGEEIIDQVVSFDGTWQKRGFTSHNGAGIIIDVLAGLVLDFEVLSNFWERCMKSEKELDDDQFQVWFQLHCENGECEKKPSRSIRKYRDGVCQISLAKKYC